MTESKQTDVQMTLEEIIKKIELDKIISKFTAISDTPVWLSDREGTKLYQSNDSTFNFDRVNSLLFSQSNDPNTYLPKAYKDILKQTTAETHKEFIPQEWLIGQVLTDGTLVWAFPITYFNELLGFLMLSGLCCSEEQNTEEMREILHIRNETPFNTNTFCQTKQLSQEEFKHWLNSFSLTAEELVENIHFNKMSILRIEVTQIIKKAHKEHPVKPPKVVSSTESHEEIDVFKRSQAWITSVYHQLCKTIQSKLCVDHIAILIGHSQRETLRVIGSSNTPKPTFEYQLNSQEIKDGKIQIKSIECFHSYNSNQHTTNKEPLTVELVNHVPADIPDIENLGNDFDPARGLWAPMLIQGRRVGILRLLVDNTSLPLREFHQRFFADLAMELNEQLETVISHYRESIIAAFPQLFSKLNFYTPAFFHQHNPFGPVAEGVQRLLNCKAVVIRIKPPYQEDLRLIGRSRYFTQVEAKELLDKAVLTKHVIGQKEWVHFEDLHDFDRVLETLELEKNDKNPQISFNDIKARIEIYKAHKLHTLLSVPVLNENDEVIGLINAFQSEHIRFSEHDVNGVLELAVHLSSFIQVKSLNDKIAKQKKREKEARQFYEQLSINLNQCEQINDLYRVIQDPENKVTKFFHPIEIWYCDKLPTFPFMDLVYRAKALKSQSDNQNLFFDYVKKIINYIRQVHTRLQALEEPENQADFKELKKWYTKDLNKKKKQPIDEFLEDLRNRLAQRNRDSEFDPDSILFPDKDKRYFKIKRILHENIKIGLQINDSFFQFYRIDNDAEKTHHFRLAASDIDDFLASLQSNQQKSVELIPEFRQTIIKPVWPETTDNDHWLPLLSNNGDRLIGFCKLAISDTQQDPSIDQDFYHNLMDFIARSLSTHIERVWRIERKTIANQLSDKFTVNIDPNIFFQDAAKFIAEVTHATGCLILGSQSLRRDALTSCGYHGFRTDKKVAGRLVNSFLEEYIHNEYKTTTHFSFKTQKPILLRRIRRHHYCRIKYINRLNEELQTDKITSYCSVPIKHANQTIGLIEIFKKQPMKGQCSFSTQDQKILEAIADKLGQSLSHYEMIREADSQIASVVHGGRSPLHAIKGFAANVKMYVAELDKRPDEHEFLISKLRELPQIIENTADLAELFIKTTMEEARLKYEYDDQEEEVDVYYLEEIDMLKKLWEIELKQKKCELKIDRPSLQDLYFRGSQSRALLLLSNLIENAIKYSDEGENITIKGIKIPNGFGIEINNLGPRAYENEEEKANLFRSFYRGRNTGGKTGSGMGLPLCKKIADYYFGKIDYECKPSDKASEDHEHGYNNKIWFAIPKKGRKLDD